MENKKTQKTPEQWFMQLREPYRSEAITNIDKTHYDYRDFQESLYDSLMDSFRWKGTKQGYDYWQDVYASIKWGETTYLEPETLKPEQMESGKWYVIKTNFRYLAQFDKIEDNAVMVSRYYYYGDGGKIKSYARLCNFEVIKSIKAATKEEVLKYFPDEVFEPAELQNEKETDWEAKYNELKAKYDQLEPKGEKVYFCFSSVTNKFLFYENINKALEISDEGFQIYEAVCIGKKKSVLVNE